MDLFSGKKSPMGSIEVPIDRKYPGEEAVKALQIAIFLRMWLAFKVRKGQKEALKAPGRHDSISHPDPKILF
jgi:hypothetical protein